MAELPDSRLDGDVETLFAPAMKSALA